MKKEKEKRRNLKKSRDKNVAWIETPELIIKIAVTDKSFIKHGIKVDRTTPIFFFFFLLNKSQCKFCHMTYVNIVK